MTLEQHLLARNNDYSQLERHLLTCQPSPLPDLHAVVPFKGAWDTLPLCLQELLGACETLKREDPSWSFRVTVVNDGCTLPSLIPHPALHTIEISHNQGRSVARNLGLYSSRLPVTLFLDADVLVSAAALRAHLQWHQRAAAAQKEAITCGLFQFMDVQTQVPPPVEWTQINDWRVRCCYQAAWACCDDDLRFAGQTFHLLEDTQAFKNWPTGSKLGPWVLPNMVLGGCFMVNTHSAQRLGGQDLGFERYGYEETTLVTRLLLHTPSYLIPILESPCFHMEQPNLALRHSKDQLLREAHHRYFQVFLQQPHASGLKVQP